MLCSEWAKPRKDCLTHGKRPSRLLCFFLFYLSPSLTLSHTSISRDPPAHLLNHSSSSPSQHTLTSPGSPHLLLTFSNLSQLHRLQPVVSTSQSAALRLRPFQPYSNASLHCLRPSVRPVGLCISSRRISNPARRLSLPGPRQRFAQIRLRIMSSSDDDVPLASKPKMNGVNGGKQATQGFQGIQY